MVRKNLNRVLWTLLASALLVALATTTACEDADCEGDECRQTPHTTVDDVDGGPLTPACERLCGFIVDGCGPYRMKAGSAADNDDCVMWCEGLSEDEVSCLAGAGCVDLGDYMDFCLEADSSPDE